MSQVSKIDVFQTDRGLHSCFLAGNVKPEWEKDFIKQHSLETLEDFVYLVQAQDWENSVAELVKAVSSLSTNRIALARFKASYEAGSQAIKMAVQAAGKSGPDNLDEPLPEATFNQVQRDFQARYNITFDPAVDPADALRARVYREFRKGSVSVIPIRNVKSILTSAAPKAQEAVQLANGLRVEFEKETVVDVSSAVQYYFGLRTLMNAWGWAGTYNTKDHDGHTRMMMPLSNALNYADEALRSCMEFSGGSVAWMAKNDGLTRGKVASLVRRGYAAQTALEEALRQTHLEWRAPALQAVIPATSGSDRKRLSPQVPEPELPEPKRSRLLKGDKFTTISMLKGGKRICKAFNDGRGCKGGCGHEHVCDVKLPNGKACQKSSHNRLQHGDAE